MKINVVGTTGSGKSTISKQLSVHFNLKYIELDKLFWKPDWKMASDEELFEKLTKELTSQPCWVLDGNYSRTSHIKWSSVDKVIWIDYCFLRTLYQAITRAVNNAFHKKELWKNTGNRESFSRLFSRDSIVLWTLKTFFKNRKKYQSLMVNPNYQHIEFIRINSPKQIRTLINSLGA